MRVASLLLMIVLNLCIPSDSFATIHEEIHERARICWGLSEVDLVEVPKIIHFVWVGNSDLPISYKENLDTFLKYTSPSWTIKVWSDHSRQIQNKFYANYETTRGDILPSSRLEFKSIQELREQFNNENIESKIGFLRKTISFDKWKILMALDRELMGFGEPRAATDIIRYMVLYMDGGYAMNFDQRPMGYFDDSDVLNRYFGALVLNQGQALKVMIGSPRSPMFANALRRLQVSYDEISPKSETSIVKRTPSKSLERRELTVSHSGWALASAYGDLVNWGLCSDEGAKYVVQRCLVGADLGDLCDLWGFKKTLGPCDVYLAGHIFNLRLKCHSEYPFSQEKIRSYDTSDL